MTWIVSLILPAMKIVAWFMDKSGADKEKKKRFFEWVAQAGKNHNSAKFMQWADEQIAWRKVHEWEETT